MLDWVLGLIGGLLYPLFSIIFVCIDGIQQVFFAFAGIGDMAFAKPGDTFGFAHDNITSGNSGAENDTGIIYYLFHNSLVKNMLISIMLLALFLTIVFTVMAFIKNVYASKQKGWKEIIGNAIKGLANFIFLPVVCFLGVWLGNILLQAINGATSGGGTTQMDRKLFITAAYNANEFRNEDPDLSDENIQKLIDWANGRRYINSNKTYDASTIEKGRTDAEYYANIVDQIYANTYTDIYSWWSVEQWYALYEINYLILIVGGIFMLYSLCSLAFAMVRRLFLLVILFIISPGVCALYPLDEGKAVQSWAGEVKKLVLSAYGAIAGINIFFSLLPLVENIGLSGGITGGVGTAANVFLTNELIQIFVMVAGLLCVKEVVGLISGFVGGEDALGKGSSMMKSTIDTTKKYSKKAIGGAFRYAGVAKEGFSAGAKGGSNWFTKTTKGAGSALSGLLKTGLKDVYKSTAKEYIAEGEKGYKTGSDSYKRQADIKKLEQMAKNYDAAAMAADTDGFTAQKIRALANKLGILDEVDKKLAKKVGMSVDDYKANLQLAKDFNSSEKAFNTADEEYNEYVKNLRKLKFGHITDVDFKDKYGIDLSKVSGDIKDTVNQIMSGVKFSADSMDVDKIMATTGKTRAQAIQYAQERKIINDAIDLKLDKDNKLSEAGEALINAAKALKKSYKEGSDATGKIFTQAVVDGVTKAVDGVLKTRDDSTRTAHIGKIEAEFDPAVTAAIKASVDKIAEDNKKSAEALNEMAKGLPSAISKAAAKAEEKK